MTYGADFIVNYALWKWVLKCKHSDSYEIQHCKTLAEVFFLTNSCVIAAVGSTMSQTEISESIRVFIRQRPDSVGIQATATPLEESYSSKENVTGVKSVSSDGKTCTYYSATNKTNQNFVVDRYFQPDTQQAELFDTIALPIVDSALLGYSGTIMAYGPTSSGKTHTMRGGMGDERGIMPRYAL